MVKNMKIRKFFAKKRDGNQFVEAAFVALFMSLFMIGFAFFYTVWMYQFSIKETVDLTLTSAMKKMETVSMSGYGAIENDIKAELESQHCTITNVTCSPNGAEVKYGDEINISLTGTYDFESDDTPFKPIIESLRKIAPGVFSENHYTIELNQSVTGTKKC